MKPTGFSTTSRALNMELCADPPVRDSPVAEIKNDLSSTSLQPDDPLQFAALHEVGREAAGSHPIKAHSCTSTRTAAPADPRSQSCLLESSKTTFRWLSIKSAERGKYWEYQSGLRGAGDEYRSTDNWFFAGHCVSTAVTPSGVGTSDQMRASIPSFCSLRMK